MPPITLQPGEFRGPAGGGWFGTEPFFGETTTAAGPMWSAMPRRSRSSARRGCRSLPILRCRSRSGTRPLPLRPNPSYATPRAGAGACAGGGARAQGGGCGCRQRVGPDPEGESAVAFTSIRAERDAPPTGAPTLAGAARAAPEMVGPGPDEAQTTPGPAAASLAPSPESGRADTASGDGASIGFFSRRARRAEPVAPPPVPRAEPGFFGIEDDAPESPVGHATGPGLSLPEDERAHDDLWCAQRTARAAGQTPVSWADPDGGAAVVDGRASRPGRRSFPSRVSGGSCAGRSRRSRSRPGDPGDRRACLCAGGT